MKPAKKNNLRAVKLYGFIRYFLIANLVILGQRTKKKVEIARIFVYIRQIVARGKQEFAPVKAFF